MRPRLTGPEKSELAPQGAAGDYWPAVVAVAQNAMTFRQLLLRLTPILVTVCAGAAEAPLVVRATRTVDAPIITEAMLPGDDGASINGPSLIRVPSWVKNPLGKYYLYFAHHAGKYLRLAYADRLEGPWKIHEGGVQPLATQPLLAGHVASPDAIIDEENQRIVLFYHGPQPKTGKAGKPGNADAEEGQVSACSTSSDGIHFAPGPRIIGPAYFRVFRHGGIWFGLNHSGVLRRARELGEPFEPVAQIIGPEIIAAVDPARLGEPGATPADQRPDHGPFRYTMRHVGLDVTAEHLTVFFSCVGHRPERILCTVVDLRGAPETWRARGTLEVLRPERPWEGSDLPLAYSRGGISRTRVNELRDPGVYRDATGAWLLYTTAGEHGIGLARLEYSPSR